MSSGLAPGETSAASPSASGPAGALFEGQVGAHYLLTLLAEADARGLPGAKIDCVELQRAGEGHPLDDVIVRATLPTGDAALLEIQVKRTVKFTASDSVFKDVIEQLAQAYRKLDLSSTRHLFAVAIERTSFKIDGAYQDVLRWAREVGSASIFIDRINRKKVGNDDMRTFVSTVRTHLGSVGCDNNDEAVWQILRRFHILTFDYGAPGSQSLELALERSRAVLEPDEASRASGFWKALTETAIRRAASGGDLDRTRLLKELSLVDRFRMRGSRGNRTPRETLLHSAALAAADLRGDIAGATLARSAQLDAVRDAMDVGRYIEIRGGPGVGKSGILGMLVLQILSESCAVVLSPERTTAGGWLALKAALGVDASPQAFLADLASDGGAVLFIDSLDFYADPEKRATVKDLVRSAAEISNFHVIVTARTDFDKEEPNWLPAEALARLGHPSAVIIEEIGEDEIDELKGAAPSLRALLANDHPARSIARNLFRLSRLLEVQGAEDLRSEVDLLERWWKTADGPAEGRRERARLLAALADNTLEGGDHIITSAAPATIDSLIASESLRELGLDRVTFRHDVLREWALAASFHDDRSKLGRLPLSRSASAPFTRGVELGARLALERSQNGQNWARYLAEVSHTDAHTSWRRWSLLAMLRSEHSLILLDRAAVELLQNDGALLRELIRTARAVEARPLADALAELGTTLPGVPSGIYVAANGSWATLVIWLLARPADIPIQILPDVVDLFQSLSASAFFLDPFTPKMALILADWLDEIEEALDRNPFLEASSALPRFATAFGHYELEKLATEVRLAFSLMAARVPDRAERYLQDVRRRSRNERTIREILKFRGALAKAAPSQLVELTLQGLIPKKMSNEDRGYSSSTRRELLTILDSEFLPSSPAQGPFLELLTAAPKEGLGLIQRLVDHVVTVRTMGKDPGDNGFSLSLPTGVRFFPWEQTYYWSRDANGCYEIESALMALEAWSHKRIEQGDDIDKVLNDVLGPQGSSAAFVLIAVDIIISHWPKTAQASAAFLACPELLSADRTRQVHDAMPEFDPLGFNSIAPKEPTGTVSLADLAKRPSRKVPLETRLPYFLHREGTDIDRVRKLLEAASTRLGAPEISDTFAEPRFMARHALHMLDKSNWQPAEGGLTYVAPPEEEEHVARLQAESASDTADFQIDAAIQVALDDSDRSNPDLVSRMVDYAKRLKAKADETEQDDLRSRAHTIVSAAMIAVRDSSDEFLDKSEDWIRGIFSEAFATEDRTGVASMRDGIRYNPVAIATLGLIHLWRRKRQASDRDALLALAGKDTPEAAQGFGAGLAVIRKLDQRIIPAAIRCALTAQIKSTRRWDATEEERASDRDRQDQRVAKAIAAECAWLAGVEAEPDWPQFPAHEVSIRQGIRIGKRSDDIPSPRRARPDEIFYSQAGALWLQNLSGDADTDGLEWIPSFVSSYGGWTASANGAGLERRVDVDSHLDQWNRIFYRLVARAMLSLSAESTISEVQRAIDVPDRSFFDIVPELTPAIDRLYFNDSGLTLEIALRLRDLIADRMLDCAGWRREKDRAKLSVEMRIGPAIGSLFFNNYSAFGQSKCYLLPKGIERVDPFFPKLAELIQSGPVPFTSMLLMNLFEVAPAPRHAIFFASSALVWLGRQPANTEVWIESGLGKRMALWIEKVLAADESLRSNDNPVRAQIEDILGRLVQLGAPEAHRIERAMADGHL